MFTKTFKLLRGFEKKKRLKKHDDQSVRGGSSSSSFYIHDSALTYLPLSAKTLDGC